MSSMKNPRPTKEHELEHIAKQQKLEFWRSFGRLQGLERLRCGRFEQALSALATLGFADPFIFRGVQFLFILRASVDTTHDTASLLIYKDTI